MAVNNTGTNYIDSLLAYDSWTGNTGQAASVGYSFAFSDHPAYAVPASFQSAYVSAMQQWSSVANVTFHAVSYATSTLDFLRADLQNNVIQNFSAGTLGVTYTYPSGSRLTEAQVAIDTQFTSMAPGTQGYFALLHEIGHALGLEHPGNYGQGEHAPYLPGGEDNIQNTVMSYFNGGSVTQTGNPPQTPMLYDIAAVQYLYGANHAYHAGNDSYAFTGAKLTEALWDGGGSDTIVTTGYHNGVTINLGEGINFKSVIGQTQVWNAFGAHIENATTGEYNDLVMGNTLNNTLLANGGNDTIYGYNGADTLNGGAGNDSLYGDTTVEGGGDGNDSLLGGAGNDHLYGMGGNDAADGGADNDMIFFGSGNDRGFGGLGIDSIYGEAGNDTLFGDSGLTGGSADFIVGGIGDDNLVGGGGNDTFYYAAGQAGHDIILDFTGAGVAGGDVLRIAMANMNGNGLMTTADLAAHVVYSGANGSLDLGGGETITLNGVGSHHLIASDFLIG